MSCVSSKTASDETELAEMEEAHTCNVADMCCQRQVLVDNDSKVTDSAGRLDAGVRQLKQVDSALRYCRILIGSHMICRTANSVIDLE